MESLSPHTPPPPPLPQSLHFFLCTDQNENAVHTQKADIWKTRQKQVNKFYFMSFFIEEIYFVLFQFMRLSNGAQTTVFIFVGCSLSTTCLCFVTSFSDHTIWCSTTFPTIMSPASPLSIPTLRPPPHFHLPSNISPAHPFLYRSHRAISAFLSPGLYIH